MMTDGLKLIGFWFLSACSGIGILHLMTITGVLGSIAPAGY